MGMPMAGNGGGIGDPERVRPEAFAQKCLARLTPNRRVWFDDTCLSMCGEPFSSSSQQPARSGALYSSKRIHVQQLLIAHDVHCAFAHLKHAFKRDRAVVAAMDGSCISANSAVNVWSTKGLRTCKSARNLQPCVRRRMRGGSMAWQTVDGVSPQ